MFVNGLRNSAKTDNPGAPQRQVANAPEWTAAGGVLYKHGPVIFSLIDKYLGQQWFADPSSATYDYYRVSGYNAAILSARYEYRRVRFGLEVQNLFGSKHVTNISPSSKTPVAAIGQATATNFDQYLYQTGRAFTGDVTVRF